MAQARTAAAWLCSCLPGVSVSVRAVQQLGTTAGIYCMRVSLLLSLSPLASTAFFICTFSIPSLILWFNPCKDILRWEIRKIYHHPLFIFIDTFVLTVLFFVLSSKARILIYLFTCTIHRASQPWYSLWIYLVRWSTWSWLPGAIVSLKVGRGFASVGHPYLWGLAKTEWLNRSFS